MSEPTRYQRIIWWLEYRYHDFVRWSTYAVYQYIDRRPKLNKLLQRLFPIQYLWVISRMEWEIGQTMNDGPDEYYMLWPDYWKMVNDRRRVKCC